MIPARIPPMALQISTEYYRFCPGEEAIKLSDAICRGRRRSNFPKCKGCQFNDEERMVRSAAVVAAREEVEPAESLAEKIAEPAAAEAIKPQEENLELLFRSSDIRGLCPIPLTADLGWRIGHAAAQFLRSKLKGYDRADPCARSLVVGRDARSASGALHAAMVRGVRAVGVTVYDLGVIDTPQLYFGVRQLRAGGGIVTTGGRSPVAYDGFKICGAGGRDVGRTTGLADVRKIATRVPCHETGDSGALYEQDLGDDYRDFVRQFIVPEFPHPITVAVDASNGAAGRWVRRLFSGIEGLTLILVNEGGDEPYAHEQDPTDSRCLAGLRQVIKREKADIAVCFDGDADACVFLDERGFLVRPDYAIALMARSLMDRCGPAPIVYDYRCSRVVGEEIERSEGTAIARPPASAQIKKTMIETDALFGATLSGQFYFRDNGMCESAMMAMAHMLTLFAAEPGRLSDRVKPLWRYRISGNKRIVLDQPDEALERVSQRFGDRVRLMDGGLTVREDKWCAHLDRRFGDTALTLRAEATDETLLRKKLQEVLAVIRGAAKK